MRLVTPASLVQGMNVIQEPYPPVMMYLFNFYPQGHRLKMAVLHYLIDTHEPHPEAREMLVRRIFHEVMSQIVFHFTSDLQQFMTNLMSIPVWATIDYAEIPATEAMLQAKQQFAEEVRSTGYQVYDEVSRRIGVLPNFHYVLDGADTMIYTISVYSNTEQLPADDIHG